MGSVEVLRDTDDHYIDMEVNKERKVVSLFLENKRFHDTVNIALTIDELENLIEEMKRLIDE